MNELPVSAVEASSLKCQVAASDGSYRTKLCSAVNLLACLSVIPVAFCVAVRFGSVAYQNAQSVCVYAAAATESTWMRPNDCAAIPQHPSTRQECFSLFGYRGCLPQPGI